MDIYESLEGGPASRPKIVASETEEPLAKMDTLNTQLDAIRENVGNLQQVARALFFVEEAQQVDSAEISNLAISDSLNGAVLIFAQTGLAAVAVEGAFAGVDNFFRSLLQLAPSARLVYFGEVFPSRGFSSFSVYRQSAASTGPAVAENSPPAELANVVARSLKSLMDLSVLGSERISEEATNALFPRNELLKVMLKSDIAVSLQNWSEIFGEDAALYTGDSDKLWPPLKV